MSPPRPKCIQAFLFIYKIKLLKTKYVGASKMAERVKVLASRPDILSFPLEAHMVERESLLQQIVAVLQTAART